jgi:hypothetical protein
MSVRLLENKSRRYSGECRRLIQKIRENIRTAASLIGKTSSWQYDPVLYLPLEIAKNKALRENRGEFESTMHISEDLRKNLKSYCEKRPTQARYTRHGKPDIGLSTDAPPNRVGSTYMYILIRPAALDRSRKRPHISTC